MNDRNELARLHAKKKTYLIGKNLPENERIKIEVTPLSIDEMSLMSMNENQDIEARKEATLKFIAQSLQIDIEDVRPIALEYMIEIIDKIVEANGLDDDDKIQAMKDRLKKANNVSG